MKQSSIKLVNLVNIFLFILFILHSLPIMANVQDEQPQGDVYVWVSPDGNDEGSGDKDSPFATLHKAFMYVRDLRHSSESGSLGTIHIIMRGGTYRLTETLHITPEDAGTEASPTIVEAAENETPIISGGVEIGSWSNPESIEGLPVIAQGHVWVASTPMSGNGYIDFRQMWIKDTKARRASTYDDLSLPRLISVDKSKGELTVPRLNYQFSHPERLEMTVIQDWTMNVLRVKTLENDEFRSRLTFLDPENVEFRRPYPYLRADENSFSNHCFYLSNAIELLNRPQEWLNDNVEGKLYYWPKQGEDMSNLKATVPVVETLVNVEGTIDAFVSNITFRGITFCYSTYMRPSNYGSVILQAGQFLYDAYLPENTYDHAWIGRPSSAVSVKNARLVGFEDCHFQHTAATALDFVSGAKQVTVRGCVFNDIGGAAIMGGYYGDENFEVHSSYDPEDKREVCDTLLINNNYITNAASEDWSNVGISIGYAANVTISNNELYYLPYTAISLGWGWGAYNCSHDNHITANYIHSFSNQLRDGGAIYTLGPQPNSSIERNRVEDVGDPLVNPVMWDMRHAQFDIYMDGGTDYFTIQNNWCERGDHSWHTDGSHITWGTNNNSVSSTIKNTAGLKTSYRKIKNLVPVISYAPLDSIGDDNNDKDEIDFVAQNEGFRIGGVLAVDLNNDGLKDIVYGGGESFQVQHGGVRMNMGNYSFAATQGLRRLFMCNFAAGDLDGDGFTDLVQAGKDFWDCYNAILTNDGKGKLTEKRLSTTKNTSTACGIADVNNDGLADIFFIGNGTDNSFYLQRQRRSFGASTAPLSLPGGFNDPSMVYADFNNDQSVDICIASNTTNGVFTRIFYNDGTGQFTETEVGINEVGTRGGMDFADVNNDGWLDLVVGGTFYGEQASTTAAQGGKKVTLYLNDQSGHFMEKQTFSEYAFDNVTHPIRFCDLDNDGNSDLIITGYNVSQGGVYQTDIWLNDGNGNFIKSDIDLPGVKEASIDVGDFGNNGRCDILITGNCNDGWHGFGGDRRIAVLRRNHTANANTTPQPPTHLQSESNDDGTVRLSWEAGSDKETTSPALSYNFYIRNLSTGQFWTSPNSDISTGQRYVSQIGNAYLNLQWTLNKLPAGKYAWSVQTIDAGYAGSAFAPEQTFTIDDPTGVEDIDAEEQESQIIINGRNIEIMVNEPREITVYSMDGRVIMKRRIEPGKTECTLPPGMYILDRLKFVIK